MNLAATLLYAYGTSEGLRKAWDTRGRGRKATSHESEKIKVFYHGTVLPSAKKILAEGLKPVAEKAFQVNMIPTSRKGYVYVTTEKELAARFAEARAAYDATQPGRTVIVHDYGLMKREEAQPAYTVPSDEKPVVVEIDIPEKIVRSFQPDPDSGETPGTEVTFLKKGIIPKEFIKKVSILEGHDTSGERHKWRVLRPDELAASKSGKTLYLVYVGPLAALKMHLKAGER